MFTVPYSKSRSLSEKPRGVFVHYKSTVVPLSQGDATSATCIAAPRLNRNGRARNSCYLRLLCSTLIITISTALLTSKMNTRDRYVHFHTTTAQLSCKVHPPHLSTRRTLYYVKCTSCSSTDDTSPARPYSKAAKSKDQACLTCAAPRRGPIGAARGNPYHVPSCTHFETWDAQTRSISLSW